MGDWECVDGSLVYAVCMVLCGLVTLVMPLLKSYVALAGAAGAFGAFIAANYSLTSIILVDQISLENFTNAYGLLLLMQGVANLIGPPLAGQYNIHTIRYLLELTATFLLQHFFFDTAKMVT